jgi:hypothetical protein
MQTDLEVRLHEAEARNRQFEGVIAAAAVLREASVPVGSPLSHRLFHEIVRLPTAESMRAHIAAQGVRPLREAAYTAAARELLAKEGKARPDGSYPIVKATDVEDAVADFGRSGGSADDKEHIIARAKAVPGGTDKLPADWAGSTRLQESARALEEIGIPTVGGGPVAHVQLRESIAARAVADIPTLDGHTLASARIHEYDEGPVDRQAAARAIAGIPTLDGGTLAAALETHCAPAAQHMRFSESEAGGLIYMPFSESYSGNVIRRIT